MLGAFLTDRTPLTDARVRKRIRAGAPIYGTSPDRPFDAPRRIPFGQLSPEAWASLTVQPKQAGDATRYVQDTGAIYAQAQSLLIVWRKAGGPCNPADFGDQASDTSGDATPRTENAIRSFQVWANANGGAGDLRTDGVLDQMTLGYLVVVTASAAQAQAKGAQPILPKWMIAAGALGLVGYVLYSEFGSTRVARSR